MNPRSERLSADPVVAPNEAGNASTFAALERYRHELRVHCYRMVGSFEDAEDLVQEALLRAWRRRETYAGRASFRAWLYRIATNTCLDFLAEQPRRPRAYQAGPLVPSAEPVPAPVDVSWLQPFPDQLLEPLAPSDAEPDTVAVAKETIELTFLVAIQRLPPRQRAVLILRDVHGWPANDVADMLDLSVASVKSALQRARATLRAHLPKRRDEWQRRTEPTAEERALLQRYIEAHEDADLDALADLLAVDVRVTMPPHPAWLVGRDAFLALTAQVFDPSSAWYHGRWRGVATQANRQPAVAQYVEEPTAEAGRRIEGTVRYRAQVLDVLRVEGGQVTEITSFEPHLFPAFGLPLALP